MSSRFFACGGVIGLPTFFMVGRFWLSFASLEGPAWIVLIVYAVAGAIMVAGVRWLLQREESSFADISWRMPTRRLAIILAVIFGLLWAALGLWGYHYFNFMVRQTNGAMGLTSINALRIITPILGVAIAIGEEIVCRGYVMTRLQKVSVHPIFQILVAGLIFGVYHSFASFTLLSFVPLVFFGAILAALYVVGKRSLTLCSQAPQFVSKPCLPPNSPAHGVRAA